jgi:hypothetical protein
METEPGSGRSGKHDARHSGSVPAIARRIQLPRSSGPLCPVSKCVRNKLSPGLVGGCDFGVAGLPSVGAAPEGGFLMVQQRLAYPACGRSGCGNPVLPPVGPIIAAPGREGMALSAAGRANMFVSVRRDHSRCGAESASEGPNPPVGARSLINRKIAEPLAVRGERLFGIPPTKELLCANPRQ